MTITKKINNDKVSLYAKWADPSATVWYSINDATGTYKPSVFQVSDMTKLIPSERCRKIWEWANNNGV